MAVSHTSRIISDAIGVPPRLAIASKPQSAIAQASTEANFGICDESDKTEDREEEAASESCAVPEAGESSTEAPASETEASQPADVGGSQSLSWDTVSWETVTTLPIAMVIPVVIVITIPAVWFVFKRRSNSQL